MAVYLTADFTRVKHYICINISLLLPCFLQVMLGGKNIEEGFGIAYRVIQVCCDITCVTLYLNISS